MTVPTVIRLTPDDVPRFLRIRRRMLEVAPWAFSATPESDKGLDADFMAASLAGEESAVFAVEGEGDGSAPPELVATAGIVRASPEKFAHRARVWGVFVEPEQRGRGLGRAVMAAAVDLARTWEGVDFVDLAVSERSPAGRSLYEALGFEAWGREPEVTVHAGRRWDEIHMTLRL
jgi:RimJ/RimL family protein N-acetyltransferase